MGCWSMKYYAVLVKVTRQNNIIWQPEFTNSEYVVVQ
jgi:hypothetical protein